MEQPEKATRPQRPQQFGARCMKHGARGTELKTGTWKRDLETTEPADHQCHFLFNYQFNKNKTQWYAALTHKSDAIRIDVWPLSHAPRPHVQCGEEPVSVQHVIWKRVRQSNSLVGQPALASLLSFSQRGHFRFRWPSYFATLLPCRFLFGGLNWI